MGHGIKGSSLVLGPFIFYDSEPEFSCLAALGLI